MKEQFAAVLKQWGDKIGLDDFAMSESDQCVLDIDGIATVVAYIAATDEFLLRAALWRSDQELPAGLAAALLSANADHRSTDGASLGVEPPGTVVLSRQAPVSNLDANGFEAILERFSDIAQVWRLNVEDFSRQARAAQQPAADVDWLKI